MQKFFKHHGDCQIEQRAYYSYHNDQRNKYAQHSEVKPAFVLKEVYHRIEYVGKCPGHNKRHKHRTEITYKKISRHKHRHEYQPAYKTVEIDFFSEHDCLI